MNCYFWVNCQSCFCDTFNLILKKTVSCCLLFFKLFSWLSVSALKNKNCSKLWTHATYPPNRCFGEMCWKWRLCECEATICLSQFFHDLNMAMCDSIRCLAKFLALWTRVSLYKNPKRHFLCPQMSNCVACWYENDELISLGCVSLIKYSWHSYKQMISIFICMRDLPLHYCVIFQAPHFLH